MKYMTKTDAKIVFCLNNYEMQLSNMIDTIEIARANNMEVLLKKNLKLKEELENIIKTVKEKL